MATTTNFGWDTPDDTDLVKDGAAAIRTLGNSIDTSFVDLKGGTTGQVLSKNSNTDLDFTWATDATGIPATIFDAKGDLIAASAADTAARLAVGTNGQVLTADSTEATGLKWVTPAGGGKVLQVVTATTSTQASGTTSTLFDSGLSASITPSANISKILVLVTQQVYWENATSSVECGMRWALLRGATKILGDSSVGNSSMQWYLTSNTANKQARNYISISYLDSPSTTSSTTYKTQIANYGSAFIAAQQGSDFKSSIILMEIGA